MTVHEGEHLVRGPAGFLRNADVSVSLDRRLEDFASHAENAPILLSISDTGVGIPPQLAEQIFDPFFTTKAHGTGVGLRICRSIIESHGGRLWALGSQGRGATFHFSLPITIPAPFRASLLLPLSSTISWSRNSTEIPRSIGLEPV
jgi:signal transduction histidine kinase